MEIDFCSKRHASYARHLFKDARVVGDKKMLLQGVQIWHPAKALQATYRSSIRGIFYNGSGGTTWRQAVTQEATDLWPFTRPFQTLETSKISEKGLFLSSCERSFRHQRSEIYLDPRSR